MNLCFFLALDRLPLGIAVTLEFTGPLARRDRRLAPAATCSGSTLAGLGILLLAPGIGDGLDPLGVVFALLAGAFWGAYILLSARVGRGVAGRGGLAVAMASRRSVLLLPIGIADGGSDLLDARPAAVGAGGRDVELGDPIPLELEALRRLPPRDLRRAAEHRAGLRGAWSACRPRPGAARPRGRRDRAGRRRQRRRAEQPTPASRRPRPERLPALRPAGLPPSCDRSGVAPLEARAGETGRGG